MARPGIGKVDVGSGEDGDEHAAANPTPLIQSKQSQKEKRLICIHEGETLYES